MSPSAPPHPLHIRSPGCRADGIRGGSPTYGQGVQTTCLVSSPPSCSSPSWPSAAGSSPPRPTRRGSTPPSRRPRQSGTVVAPVVVPAYGYGWHPFGWGFGFFGLFATLFFVFIVFALIRAIFWRGGPGRRGWAAGPTGRADRRGRTAPTTRSTTGTGAPTPTRPRVERADRVARVSRRRRPAWPDASSHRSLRPRTSRPGAHPALR